jgi:hypothetical protein
MINTRFIRLQMTWTSSEIISVKSDVQDTRAYTFNIVGTFKKFYNAFENLHTPRLHSYKNGIREIAMIFNQLTTQAI